MKKFTNSMLTLALIAGSCMQETHAFTIRRNPLRVVCGSMSAIGTAVAYKYCRRPYEMAKEDPYNTKSVKLKKIYIHEEPHHIAIRYILATALVSSGFALYRLLNGRTPEHKIEATNADLDRLMQENPMASFLPKDNTAFVAMIEGMYPGDSGMFKAAVDLREWQVKLVAILDTLAQVRKEIAGDAQVIQQCEAVVERARQAVFNITAALKRVEKHIKHAHKHLNQAQ